MTIYNDVEDGEWIRPQRKGYKLCCCDCSLIHKVDFRIKNSHIEFRAFRDNRATGQKRRHQNITIEYEAFPFKEM